jgi:uncharacterized protein DUF6265
MRALCGLIVVTAMAVPLCAQKMSTVDDLAFVSGCWRLESNGRTIEEHWLAPAGGSLIGVGRTVSGGKTVEYEFLQIRETADGLTYIAKPSGQAEASFPLVSHSVDEVVFENPTHDFPQRIRYRRAGPDALHARIEGTMNGKARGIDFPYARAACPAGK